MCVCVCVCSPRWQSFILTVDWTVVALMAQSIGSVVMHPKELAFVRLRCDGRSSRRVERKGLSHTLEDRSSPHEEGCACFQARAALHTSRTSYGDTQLLAFEGAVLAATSFAPTPLGLPDFFQQPAGSYVNWRDHFVRRMMVRGTRSMAKGAVQRASRMQASALPTGSRGRLAQATGQCWPYCDGSRSPRRTDSSEDGSCFVWLLSASGRSC